MITKICNKWISCCVLLVFGFLFVSDGAEEGASMKRARAPAAPQLGGDPPQELEHPDRAPPAQDPLFPPSFLSPSVHEYLELGKSIPGRPGTDYPILSAVPYTNFYCDEQKYPGFFADPETRCQGWHYCDLDGRQASFLCPNGTQFSQPFFVCDWWFNVRCDLSEQLYYLNDRLYRRPQKALDPARPHRTITKHLLEDIFNN